VRRHARASSAGSTLGRGKSSGSFFRGAFVARGLTHLGDESGAPSGWGSVVPLVSSIVALALLLLAPLAQGKVAVNGFGTEASSSQSPLLGGRFASFGNVPAGIAINGSGAGAAKGTAYAIDLHRVQRFGPTGEFERAWGQDVIATSHNEQQKLTIRATGGTFTLAFKGATTAPIPGTETTPNGVLESARKALRSLPSIGEDNVFIVGGTGGGNIFVEVTFQGTLAATDQPQLSADTSELEGTVNITTLVEGVGPATTGGSSTGFEICTVAGHCKIGSTSGTTSNGGQLNLPRGVAVNQSNGHVYVTEQGNRRVSEFDADGAFIRTWGWDVVKAGGAGDVSTDAFEVCAVAADCKQAAAAGAEGGRFGAEIGYPVTDSAGNVWVPDPSNRRIQEFDPSGNFIAAYGYDVDALGGTGALESCTSTAPGACKAATQGSGAGQFSASNPKEVAFDSAGNLYAIDAGNNRVQRFDPTLLASATSFGAATLATFSTQAPEHLSATEGGARIAFALNNNLTANPAERQIVELDPSDASVEDTSLVGAKFNNVNVGGLGADAASGALHATVPSFGGLTPTWVIVLDAAPPSPTLGLNGVTSKTDTTATFAGSIDPKGAWVGGCEFQYSTDQITWTDLAEPGCASLDPNGGSQAVSEQVTGLDPNTKYFVRLAASRPLTPNSTVTSNSKAFTTDAVPPAIADLGAIEIGDTSARMVATIDPRNSDTGYSFQYGTTPALGSSTAPLEIGGGTTPITVSQAIGGLSPDTTYYFRAVATNLTGTTASPSKTFHTRVDPLPLPEDRGWEQVTPPDKNYGDGDNFVLQGVLAGVSRDGNAAAFCTTALFGEPAGRMTRFCAPYLSRRTPSGWQTTSPWPDYCHIDPVSGDPLGILIAYPSPDYSRFVIQQPESDGCPVPPLDPAAPLIPGGISHNLYLQDPTTDPASYDLLNPHLGGRPGGELSEQEFLAGSDDFSHVVYQSFNNQTAPPDSPEPDTNFRKLYDWEREGHGPCTQPGGCLSLLSKDPDDEPFTTPSAIPTIESLGGGVGHLGSSVSGDGERVFFQNPVPSSGSQAIACDIPGCQLYMREGGATTYDVSVSECTLGPGPCGSPQTVADKFLSATSSGAEAFFTSCAKLTDDSAPEVSCTDPYRSGGATGSKLYRWDRDAAPGHQLIDLTVDHEPSDGSQPDFAGLIGHSEDGEVAYFVTGTQSFFSGASTGGQIVSGEPTFVGEKLYRWRYNGGNPTLDYIAPYERQLGRFGSDINWMQQRHHVTPDGQYLLIYTSLAYDPAADRDTDADAYRWDEAGGWICLSCQDPGEPSGGDVDLSDVQLLEDTSGFSDGLSSNEPKFLISDDGQRVFFGTPDALVPADVNGEAGCPLDTDISHVQWVDIYVCEDVYEWHDGTVSLISGGIGTSPARLISTTPSGRDVFFFTRERLVGWDVDRNVDLYDARIGGGFPEPPAQPVPCEGEACRGGGTTPPATTGAGTAVFQGPGNPAPKQGKPRKGKKRQHKGKKRKGKRQQRAANSNRRAGR
jgi:hypothetical protein